MTQVSSFLYTVECHPGALALQSACMDADCFDVLENHVLCKR